MGATLTTVPTGIRPSTVLRPDDVVDDEVLHPGAVVWLAEPQLAEHERDQFRAAARQAAMARHPAGRARHLRLVGRGESTAAGGATTARGQARV